MTWLRTAWAWLTGRAALLGLIAAGVMLALWMHTAHQRDDARRERDAETARADAATDSAERERQVMSDLLAAQSVRDAELAEIAATRVEAEATRTTARKRLTTSVDVTGSTADEANRRIEARERGE